MNTGLEPYVDIAQAAAFLRVPKSYLYARTAKKGKAQVPHHRIGKYVRFRLSELEAWVQAQGNGASDPLVRRQADAGKS